MKDQRIETERDEIIGGSGTFAHGMIADERGSRSANDDGQSLESRRQRSAFLRSRDVYQERRGIGSEKKNRSRPDYRRRFGTGFGLKIGRMTDHGDPQGRNGPVDGRRAADAARRSFSLGSYRKRAEEIHV